TPPPPPAIEVPVASVVEKTVPVFLTYAGSTDALRTVTLQALVTGYLLKRLVTDGSDVMQGQLLYQIDPGPYQAVLDQAKAQEQKDAAALEYAKASRTRNEAMAKNGDVSLDTLQQSTSSEQQYVAAVAADKAAIETAQLNLNHTQIHAPFAGRVGISILNEGALINTAGSQINTLVQLDPIYATFNPPDADLPQIQRYQSKSPIPVEIDVGSGADVAHYNGKLALFDNNVGRGTGTITARALIDNPHHTLLPGQFIRVRLHVTDVPGTLLVPQVAVGSSQLGKYVYVVGRDNKVEQRFVTLGDDYDPLVVVTRGVAKGESVVVGNLLKIGPGALVKPVPAQLQSTASVR
ncbi:MAG: efflux RND transporter periplasmic adaptor subunit, partial [Alphaproteobacteria bacterium]|nr:efflux RND transporter periplasmic adaptor subunit [Alphaproteobacteria bacterium]